MSVQLKIKSKTYWFY